MTDRDERSLTTAPDEIGVVFDMDGVLVDSAEAHLESWRGLARELGAPLSTADVAATFGRQNRDIIPILFGVTEPTEVQALADRKEVLYRDIVRLHLPVVDGAVALIDALHEAGCRLAVGSSAPRANIDLVLDRVDRAHCFHAIVSGDDVRRGKPDPQVFLLACERLALAPHRCIVIEDAPAGIVAAKRAGARAVAVLPYHGHDAFDDPDLTANALCDLAPSDLYKLVGSRSHAPDACG